MKNFHKWSEETLKRRIESLKFDIEDWERILSQTNSVLITMCLEHYIEKARDEIHAINAELFYRANH